MEHHIQREKKSDVSRKTQNRERHLKGDTDKRICIAGHDSAYPPWVFVSNGAATGISVSIFRDLCKGGNFEPSFSPGQWCTLFPELLDQRLDCLLNVGWPSSFFDSQPVIPSLPYESFHTRLFMHKKYLPDTGKIDGRFLSGKKVGMQKGSFMAQFLEPFHCEIVEFENDIQSMVSHIWNRIDAVCVEQEVGKFLSKRFFHEDIVPVTESLGTKDVVLLFRKGSEEMRDRFNEMIENKGK